MMNRIKTKFFKSIAVITACTTQFGFLLANENFKQLSPLSFSNETTKSLLPKEIKPNQVFMDESSVSKPVLENHKSNIEFYDKELYFYYKNNEDGYELKSFTLRSKDNDKDYIKLKLSDLNVVAFKTDALDNEMVDQIANVFISDEDNNYFVVGLLKILTDDEISEDQQSIQFIPYDTQISIDTLKTFIKSYDPPRTTKGLKQNIKSKFFKDPSECGSGKKIYIMNGGFRKLDTDEIAEKYKENIRLEELERNKKEEIEKI